MDEATQLWNQLLEKARAAMNVQAYETWFAPVRPVSLQKDVLELEVPNRFSEEWLREHYQNTIETMLHQIASRPIRIRLSISTYRDAEPEPKPSKAPHVKRILPPPKDDNLNSKYTFDNFVVGPSNRFAYAASIAVSDSPAEAYNPLFIYGAAGLGKTHLMQAIAHRIRERNPRARISYLSSEEFTNQLIHAIQNKETIRFKNKYRTVDILLIDDIHFLGGKEQTQEEFFHTFNTLYNAHKQIVLSSDRPPKEIPNLEERLVSRFEWGLVTDLQPPDMETRIAILRKKSVMLNLPVPEEIATFLASKIKTNIRKLEGALIRVVSYASMTGKTLSLELAEEAIQDILSDEKNVTIDSIQRRVADLYGIRLADLTSRKRPKNIAFAWQVAMYLIREMTSQSLESIGEAFGRDHTTVMHAVRIIENELKKDFKLKKDLSFLKMKLMEENP